MSSCCCTSLFRTSCTSVRKWVILVGVICLLAASILVLINVITCITFEEHVLACRVNVTLDAKQVFPPCRVLLDVSLLMAVRIYIYIQVLTWVFEIIVSILLIVSAMKKRSNLMIPWVIVSILALMMLIWNACMAVMEQEGLVHILLLLGSILFVMVFLGVVRRYSVELSTAPRYCHHVRDITLHHIQGGESSCYECRKPPAVTALLGPPPAYSQYNSSSKGTLPLGLGIHI